jgi:aminopeptidase YwaD
MVAPEGGKEPLRAEYSAYTMGSDHDVYQDSSFGIPAIYLNDWPDRYIHTNFDTAANIDPTKLKRAAFIGAASGYFLAGFGLTDLPSVLALLEQDSLRLAEQIKSQRRQLNECDGGEVQRFQQSYIRPLAWSVSRFDVPIDKTVPTLAKMGQNIDRNGEGMCAYLIAGGGVAEIYRRSPNVKGPLAMFGYDYFSEHAKVVGVAAPKLLRYEGLWGADEEYAYETLNFVDGSRTALDIAHAVSAEYGPVPFEIVGEYLKALEKIGVVEQVK